MQEGFAEKVDEIRLGLGYCLVGSSFSHNKRGLALGVGLTAFNSLKYKRKRLAPPTPESRALVA